MSTLPRDTDPIDPATARTVMPGASGPHKADLQKTDPQKADPQKTIAMPFAGETAAQIPGQPASVATHFAIDATRMSPPMPAAPPTLKGQVWGDFEIGDLLGRGGMGAVYRGRQLSLDRPVAIKVLSEHLIDNSDFRKRFLLEARAAARINTASVVQVYFAGEHAGHHFFAMEFVAGTDLAAKLKSGWRPSHSEALDLVIQAARSLSALADFKIVHRDIKPANYMLTTRGDLKLMDFGLAKFASESHGLTQTGMVMGTVSYFSPEQGRGEPCDSRTDLYALGVMFYELLTGKLPFTGNDATSVIYQHIHMAPKPPTELNPQVPDPYQSVVLKCLEKRADDRYQSAAALLLDLERIKAGLPVTVVLHQPSGLTSASGTRKNNAAVWFIAAAALSLIIGWFVWPRVAAAKDAQHVPGTITDAAVTTAPAPSSHPTLAAQATPAVPVALAQPMAHGAPDPDPQPPAAVPTAAAIPVPFVPVIAVPVVAVPVVAVRSAIPSSTIISSSIPPPVVPAAAPVATPLAVIEPIAPAPVPTPVVAAPVPPAPTPTPEPEPTPIAPTPAPVATATVPAPISVSAGRSAHITLPNAPNTPGQAILWWLEGTSANIGRLDARTTTRGDITWMAPASPGALILHSITVPSGAEHRIPLVTTALNAWDQRTLQPFARLFADEVRPGRMARDADGSWWLLDPDRGTLAHISAGWMASAKFTGPTAPKHATAISVLNDVVAIADSDQHGVILYTAAGQPRTLGPCERPLDVALMTDGRVVVADPKAGGILVFSNDGHERQVLGRSGTAPGGFDRLTHVRAGDDGTILALDTGAKKIIRFDARLLPLPAVDVAADAVDIATNGNGFLVLSANGEIRTYDAGGVCSGSLPTAASAQLGDDLGPASSIYRDVSGELLVTYQARGWIARYDGKGAVSGLRHARLASSGPQAADACGRSFVIDRDTTSVLMLDSDGWCVQRLGGPQKKGGFFRDPSAIAVQGDGRAVAVLDKDLKQVIHIDLTASPPRTIAFASPGKNDGQFDSPIAIAMDDAGRTYVLDEDLHRVSVFDAGGAFRYSFGRYQRGGGPDQLRAPRQFAVTPDGRNAFVYDDDDGLVKTFALEQNNRRGLYTGSWAGRGEGPGKIQRLSGLATDRLGLVYLLDGKRGDLQVFDLRGATPTLVHTVRMQELGLRKAQRLSVSPDGIVMIGTDDGVVGLRW